MGTAAGGRIVAAMKRDARFSGDRRYRYALWRKWDAGGRFVMFVCLNPSTADEEHDDATLARCISFAQSWGFGGLCLANLFAFVATKPKILFKQRNPVGDANDRFLCDLAEKSETVIAGWGNRGGYLQRDEAVRKILPHLHYLRLTKAGYPSHPLYLPKSIKPKRWQ
jgi:hypothetical protein